MLPCDNTYKLQIHFSLFKVVHVSKSLLSCKLQRGIVNRTTNSYCLLCLKTATQLRHQENVSNHEAANDSEGIMLLVEITEPTMMED